MEELYLCTCRVVVSGAGRTTCSETGMFRSCVHASCASGDWLTSRPKGCSQPRELWFFDILT